MVYGLSNDPLQALKGLKQKGATTTSSTPNFTTLKGKTETAPTMGLKPKQLAEIGGYGGGFSGITKSMIGSGFSQPKGAEKTAMVNMPQEIQQRIVQDVQNKSVLPGTQGFEQNTGIDTTEPQFIDTNIVGQITDDSPAQLYLDIKAGMPVGEVAKYYPEYAANLATINELKGDIDAGMPEVMIPQYYPELYPQTGGATEQARGGGVRGAAAAMSPIDLGPVGETIINPIGRVAEIIDNQIQKLGSFDVTKTAEENLDKRVSNLTQKELETYQKEREVYKKNNPGLAKMYNKTVEGDNLLAQMWNIVTGDTKDRSDVDAFKDFVRQREKKFIEEFAGADTKGPHIANIMANVPGSAVKTVSSIGRAVLNPADTLAGLGKIVFTAEGRQAIIDRYGSREAFAKTLETDPIGVASDVLSVVEGGAGIVKAGAKVTAKVAAKVGATETMKVAGRVAEKAGEFGKVSGVASDLGMRQVLPYQLGKVVKAVENVPVIGKIAKYGEAMTTPLDTFISVAKPIIGKLPNAAETLQKMNRMTAGDQRKFLREQGMTEGEFINKEYGAVSPREAVEKALTIVNENKEQVNQGVEQIKGPQKFKAVEYIDQDGNSLKYEGDAISDMADMGIKRATDTNNPIKKVFVDFNDKYSKGQADMTDINNIQRTFQKNVAMAYYSDLASGDKKARATNIDTAVRERKMQKGIDYGFDNFREINRNTKAHMAIVKGLEKREAGKAGNNAVSLTDWIMVAPAVIEPAHLSGLIAKKILQSNWFSKNYVRILNKLNGHKVVGQRIADIKTISRISNEIELNKWLLNEENNRLATTGLPSPKTVSPSRMGTPQQPIPLKGNIGEIIEMKGRKRSGGWADAPQIGDDTKLGKVVAVTHTGGGFPKYSVKIEGYNNFTPIDKIEGGIYEGTKEAKATTKSVEVMPREEPPTEKVEVDQLNEFGDKRKYYAQGLIEELGFEKMEDIQDIAIKNEIARIIRMKDGNKVDDAVAVLKESIKPTKIPLSHKSMKNDNSGSSSSNSDGNNDSLQREANNKEIQQGVGGSFRHTGRNVIETKPMPTKANVMNKKHAVKTEHGSFFGKMKYKTPSAKKTSPNRNNQIKQKTKGVPYKK